MYGYQIEGNLSPSKFILGAAGRGQGHGDSCPPARRLAPPTCLSVCRPHAWNDHEKARSSIALVDGVTDPPEFSANWHQLRPIATQCLEKHII